MNDLAYKCMGISGVEVKDPERGEVEAVVARTNVMDRDGDVFLPGAFGTRNVRVSAYNHRSWPQRGGLPPVGRGSISERGNEVVAEMKFFMSTAEGRDAFEVVKEMGELQEWSFGWLPGGEVRGELTEDLVELGARRAIKSVPVEEVSPVLLGASVGTRTIGVKECETCGQKLEDEAEPEEEPEETSDPSECELKEEIAQEVERFKKITAQVT